MAWGSAVSILMTDDMTPAHRAAWRRLTDAIRALDVPDGLTCSIDPESCWPGDTPLSEEERQTIRAMCVGCPVRAECRALGRFERRGIWGGQQFIRGQVVT